MSTNIIVPALGESVSSATIARWLKGVGDSVKIDEPIVELETDKVTVEVNAVAAGFISSIAVEVGAEVVPGTVLGVIADSAAGGKGPSAPFSLTNITGPAQDLPSSQPPPLKMVPDVKAPASTAHAPLPSASKMMAEAGVSQDQIGIGTGKGGRISKGDVMEFLAKPSVGAAAAVAGSAANSAGPAASRPARSAEPGEERVKMTRLRLTIANRLKEAQNTAAMLTTFNEVDMGAAMALRAEYKDAFEKRHGVKLGFMSFFVKACVAALREYPAVNAEIDGDEVVYKRHVHMGIAVGGPNGLVVPVLRNAEDLGFADVEKAIGGFGKRARDGQLKLEELSGGSFTITNGGIYGSLMSTPILNPPQSGILGMHKIQDRPMVVGGKIEIRPMMYLALSYDHRIVDGKEAVSFLVRVKASIEDPRRLMLDL